MKKNVLLDNKSLFIATIASSILSYVGVEVLHGPLSAIPGAEGSGTYFPGFIFGLLVFAPRIAAVQYRLLRQVAAVVVTTLLYFLAIQVGVFLALGIHLPASVAGTVAAMLSALALCAIAMWLVPMRVSRDTWRKAAIFGAMGGAVLGIPTGNDTPRIIEIGVVLLGLMIWQVGVGVLLFRQSRSSK
jgi:hypothetical protein